MNEGRSTVAAHYVPSEYEIRTMALSEAIRSSHAMEELEAVIARAEAYLKFLKAS